MSTANIVLGFVAAGLCGIVSFFWWKMNRKKIAGVLAAVALLDLTAALVRLFGGI